MRPLRSYSHYRHSLRRQTCHLFNCERKTRFPVLFINAQIMLKIAYNSFPTRCLFGILCSEGGVGLEADGIDANESLCIGGVVVKGITSSLNVHGSQIGIVQGVWRSSALDNDISLVKVDLDLSNNIALGKGERVADEFHLWGEPESVVAKTGKFVGHALGDALDLTIHADSLQVHVCGSQQSSSGGLVDTARLDSDESVFDNVDAADSVLSGNHVAVQENIERIGLDGSVGLVGDLGWDSLVEFNDDGFGSVGGVLWRDGHLEHGFLRSAGGILEASRFVGGVEKVLVDGVVGLGLGIDRDSVLFAVGKEILSSLEGLDEFGITPWGDAFDGRRQGLGAHLESDLVISLSGSTVGNVLGVVLGGDANHFLGNARTGDGGTEEVSSLVDSVGLDAVKNVIGDEFLSQIGNDTLAGTNCQSLGLDGGEIFLELSNVGAKGDDVKSLFAQPFEDNGSIKTTGVGKDKLGFGFGHDD